MSADFNGDNYTDNFIGDLVNFVAGESFQTMFEKFFLTFALEFTNDEEHKLRYYELYQEFHGLFEAQLEDFCRQMKCDTETFMIKCREASSSDAKVKHYIDILLSSVEYDTFVKLMKIMRPVAEAKLKMAAMISEKKKEEKASSVAETKTIDEDDGDNHPNGPGRAPSKMLDSDIDAVPSRAPSKMLDDDETDGPAAGSKAILRDEDDDYADAKSSTREATRDSPEKGFK